MKNPFSRITLGIAMLTTAMLSCTSVHADVLKAGTAKVNITPPDSPPSRVSPTSLNRNFELRSKLLTLR